MHFGMELNFVDIILFVLEAANQLVFTCGGYHETRRKTLDVVRMAHPYSEDLTPNLSPEERGIVSGACQPNAGSSILLSFPF